MNVFNLEKGDKVAIVSLSSGILGEEFAEHELQLGIKRLKEFGLIPVVMNNSLKGIDYLKMHPEARAEDLKQAFMDYDVKMIITAIGGDDTYKTIPYLLDDKEFRNAVKENPKIFTGFSDTTNNHFMFHKLGLSTFYGPCFLVDLAELDKEMLPYTKNYFEKYFSDNEIIEIKSSDVWYEDRKSYDVSQIGKPRIIHKETHGFETIKGSGIVTGKLFGGCIDSIYDMFVGERYGDENVVFEKYDLLPTLDEWKEKILFLETSEEKPTPLKLKEILLEFKRRDILNNVKGIIVGKPIDEVYYEEYKEIYLEVMKDCNTPIMYNINFGHASPRCFLQYDAEATIDYDKRTIFIKSKKLTL